MTAAGVAAWRSRVGALATLLCAGAAGDAPVLRPIHDVDVTYTVDNGGRAPLHERLRWSVTTRELRVDPPTRDLYVIIDLAARRMRAVRTAERTVIEMAAPTSVTGMPEDAAASAVRQGTDLVAGLSCTEWDLADAIGQPTRVCLTEDGVLLWARAGERTLLAAEAVHYGPLNPDVFQVPAGYAHQSMGPLPAAPSSGPPPQTQSRPTRARPRDVQ